MRANTPYLLHQIARFGSLTIRELRALTEGRCSRPELYKCLKAMIDSKLVVRIDYSNAGAPIYQPTDAGLIAAFGETPDHSRSARAADKLHSLRVAQTLIALARYEHVTGFGTEFEIPLEEWRKFSGSKVPDGVIQVTRGDLTYELAVEVELTPKSASRSEDFLNKYQEAFGQKARCSGVILICDESDIFNRYQSLLRRKGEALAKRFLVIRGPELPTLNPKLYGRPEKSRRFCGDLRRSSFSDGVRYLPMKFALRGKSAAEHPPDRDPLSGNLKLEEDSQPIRT